MNMKKTVILCAAFLLLLGADGCGNLPFHSNGGSQAPSSQAQGGESEQESGMPDSGAFSVSSESAMPDSGASSVSAESAAGASSIQKESSASTAVSSFQTQQDVLNQIRTDLDTKVPVMLPTGVPVKNGRCLTATTASQKTHYEVKLYETDQPAKLNSKSATKGTLLATITGTVYQNAASAKDSIIGYEQADLSNGESLDLGHNIRAEQDTGLGHQQLTWNEGRWCLRIDSPTDPANQSKEYPDMKQLAKSVVAYLDTHMLPAPQKIGVISMDIWKWNCVTTVEWQQNQTVYQVGSKDPMTALEAAVAMKKAK